MSDEVLDALRHPKRRLILELLAQKGPLTFTDLLELSGIRRTSALAFHLKKLRGLISKKGNVYVITEAGIEALMLVKSTKRLIFRQTAFWTITGTPINTISMITQIIMFLYFLYISLLLYESIRYFSFSSFLALRYMYEIAGIIIAVIWAQILSIILFKKIGIMEKLEINFINLLKAFMTTPYFYAAVYYIFIYIGLLLFKIEAYHFLRGLIISFSLVLPTTLNFEEVKSQSKLSIKFIKKKLVCYLSPIV